MSTFKDFDDYVLQQSWNYHLTELLHHKILKIGRFSSSTGKREGILIWWTCLKDLQSSLLTVVDENKPSCRRSVVKQMEDASERCWK